MCEVAPVKMVFFSRKRSNICRSGEKRITTHIMKKDVMNPIPYLPTFGHSCFICLLLFSGVVKQILGITSSYP